jgi:hypothetical protein
LKILSLLEENEIAKVSNTNLKTQTQIDTNGNEEPQPVK